MPIVRTTLDPESPTRLTEAEKAAYDSMSDSDIDYSDSPEISDAMFASGWRGSLTKPTKEQISLRVDTDVLLWLRSLGNGYQTRINKILRVAMHHHKSDNNS